MQINWLQSNQNCFNINKKYVIEANSSHPNNRYCGLRLSKTYNKGKFYYEVTFDSISRYMLLGICTKDQDINAIARYGDFIHFIGISTIGECVNKGNYTSSINKVNINDTIGVCLDFDNQQIGVIINGKYTSIDNKMSNNCNWYPCFWFLNATDRIAINFGHKSFKYDIPNGFRSFLLPYRFLLEQNNQLYTIKSEFYEPSKLQYKPITGVDINNITDEHLKKYGFDDIGDIMKTIAKENMIMERDDDLGSGIQFSISLNNAIKIIDDIYFGE
ncbi:spry domain protein [Clostridium botulinum C str. Eklund]|nr:spry domain protein [Clostridium botulinum C str. Eklund]